MSARILNLAPAPPVAVRAAGAWIEAADGRRWLDCTSGSATCNLGHGHPRVIAAARAQLERLVHVGGAADHDGLAPLAAALAGVAPRGVTRFAFATTGGEAVELALRLARASAGRPLAVAFRGGFHGRTLGARAASTSRARLRTGLVGEGVRSAPFPRPFEWRVDDAEAADRALAGLDELHRHEVPPEETACYLVEPVQGQGGCHPAGRRFLAGLRERADRHGALLVLDEVQTGLGRTGDWFAAGRYGVRPDVLCLGKALGVRLPALGGRGLAGAHGAGRRRRGRLDLRRRPDGVRGGTGRPGGDARGGPPRPRPGARRRAPRPACASWPTSSPRRPTCAAWA